MNDMNEMIEIIPQAVEPINEPALPIIQLSAVANQLHGQAVMVGGLRKFFAAAEIKILKEIRDRKLFKHIAIEIEPGFFAPAKNFAEYVDKGIETSTSVVYEEIQTFEEFGSDAHDALNRLGVLRDEKRLLRKLPDEIKAQAQEAAEKGDKTVLLEIIAQQAAERQKEREQADQASAEAAKAKDELIAQLNAAREVAGKQRERMDGRIQELEEALELRKKSPPKADERVQAIRADLSREAEQIRCLIDAGLRRHILALRELDGVDWREQLPFLAGILAEAERNINGLRGDYGIPTMLDGDPRPEAFR
jgi:hypothetical protein